MSAESEAQEALFAAIGDAAERCLRGDITKTADVILTLAVAYDKLVGESDETPEEPAPYGTGSTAMLPLNSSEYEEEYRTRPSIGF